MTDVAYDPRTGSLEAELAYLLTGLWGTVAPGGLTFRQFVTEAADLILQFRETAWLLSDVELAVAMAMTSGLPIEPVGYGMPPRLSDAAFLEQQIVRMMFSLDNEQIRAAEQVSQQAGYDELDARRAQRLDQLGRNEVSHTWRASQGAGIDVWSRSGLVLGYRRVTFAGACAWCRSLAGVVRPETESLGPNVQLGGNVFAGDMSNVLNPQGAPGSDMPMHANDRCYRMPVMVPLTQIDARWRDGYAQRLARQEAQRPVESTYTEWVSDVPDAA